jgi:hypothetical protein
MRNLLLGEGMKVQRMRKFEAVFLDHAQIAWFYMQSAVFGNYLIGVTDLGFRFIDCDLRNVIGAL